LVFTARSTSVQILGEKPGQSHLSQHVRARHGAAPRRRAGQCAARAVPRAAAASASGSAGVPSRGLLAPSQGRNAPPDAPHAENASCPELPYSHAMDRWSGRRSSVRVPCRARRPRAGTPRPSWQSQACVRRPPRPFKGRRPTVEARTVRSSCLDGAGERLPEPTATEHPT
jgi:hypothetical protein